MISLMKGAAHRGERCIRIRLLGRVGARRSSESCERKSRLEAGTHDVEAFAQFYQRGDRAYEWRSGEDDYREEEGSDSNGIEVEVIHL
jgi:hypothetical protein